MLIEEVEVSGFNSQSCKRRRLEVSSKGFSKMEEFLPSLSLKGYYMIPCLDDLAAREIVDPGFLIRVPDFTVGRVGYGCVRFLGETDVRWLDLDRVVRFCRHEIVVYGDIVEEPAVGEGLNKAAEVSLKVRVGCKGFGEGRVKGVVEKLKECNERQGARFVSFNSGNAVWKFLVPHFSRFGLSEDDEEDIAMDDAVEDPEGEMVMGGEENGEVDGDMEEGVEEVDDGPMLYHSLPAHLRLDPVKMREMRMLMFPKEEEGVEDLNGPLHWRLQPSGKEYLKSPLKNSSTQNMARESSPLALRKTPLALLEYNPSALDASSTEMIMLSQQNKGLTPKMVKGEGFKLDLKRETPITGSHSRNIVDAGLFMGRSFRVGWGPNGVLVHCGAPVGSNGFQRILSSVINVEKVAIDKVVRDEKNKVREELEEFAFEIPLNLHKELNHEKRDIEVGPFKLKLQKAVSNRLTLSETCRSYIDILDRSLEIPGLSSSARLVVMHQVMIWELIKVLFSERENGWQSKSVAADNEEDMMQDSNGVSLDVDQEALPLIRRAEFSCWLQESVCHCVQEDVSSLDESSYLEHIFLLLTGRQLDGAVELAASRGDVRLACLLSQAGGSIVNRSDLARQLNLWRMNGLDFNFIEKERVRLYELLSGNIFDALLGVKIDWKRFLGLLMWYRLAPNMPLSRIFYGYQQLLVEGKAPYPLPIYIDEGPAEGGVNFKGRHYDLSYYLMLLHASGEDEFGFLKTMFSALSSTNDPLDYHMIWHQREILQAAGIFTSNDLQILDMGLVSQLLCAGKCHWAIYVVLHMPYCNEHPYLHAMLIREILFQHCETWSSDYSQQQFIENLDIPGKWLHEALAVYFNYHGDLLKALEHFLECGNWQKAHSIFLTSVSHQLFLSANHSEVWRIATLMEDHKSEIENWDLGAGLYLSFYMLKSSLKEDPETVTQLTSLESRNSACRDFLHHLKESLASLDERLPRDARVAFSRMAEEISEMLLSNISEGSTRDVQLSCFDTVFTAPIPEDLRLNHLQDGVSLFTCYLSEMSA